MSSLIEGYNYDIFISYRQKDNQGDHWVTEFVEALKTARFSIQGRGKCILRCIKNNLLLQQATT